jgi:hypothetical protein
VGLPQQIKSNNQLGLLTIGGDVSGAVNGDDDDNHNNVHNSEEVVRGHATLGMISDHYCHAEVDATTRDGMGFISIMIQQTL